jgi:predicted enzyme related to lactoylglutathione lyase
VNPAIKIGAIVLRVKDLPRQMEFWMAALDYVPRDAGEPQGNVVLRPRAGSSPNLDLDTARSEVHIPPRIHLDLYAKDPVAEVERLKALGATEVHWDRMPADADFTILADPEGNRFCVIDKSNPRTEWG